MQEAALKGLQLLLRRFKGKEEQLPPTFSSQQELLLGLTCKQYVASSYMQQIRARVPCPWCCEDTRGQLAVHVGCAEYRGPLKFRVTSSPCTLFISFKYSAPFTGLFHLRDSMFKCCFFRQGLKLCSITGQGGRDKKSQRNCAHA
eukprot:scaffold79350_cov18-Tisochrysis_lutea.AAC.1